MILIVNRHCNTFEHIDSSPGNTDIHIYLQFAQFLPWPDVAALKAPLIILSYIHVKFQLLRYSYRTMHDSHICWLTSSWWGYKKTEKSKVIQWFARETHLEAKSRCHWARVTKGFKHLFLPMGMHLTPVPCFQLVSLYLVSSLTSITDIILSDSAMPNRFKTCNSIMLHCQALYCHNARIMSIMLDGIHCYIFCICPSLWLTMMVTYAPKT